MYDEIEEFVMRNGRNIPLSIYINVSYIIICKCKCILHVDNIIETSAICS